MSSTFHITLDEGDLIDGNRITQTRSNREATYTLPRKAKRVVMHADRKFGRLDIGGFTTITVSVKGPVELIDQLREAVL